MTRVAAVLLPIVLTLSTGMTGPRYPFVPALESEPDTLRGTVLAVKPDVGYLDVLTGVGLALRVVHIRAVPETHVAAAGAAVSLPEIKPGDIVRVEYRVTTQGNVAEKIERVGRMGSGAGGVP